jgi:hypothetical protein
MARRIKMLKKTSLVATFTGQETKKRPRQWRPTRWNRPRRSILPIIPPSHLCLRCLPPLKTLVVVRARLRPLMDPALVPPTTSNPVGLASSGPTASLCSIRRGSLDQGHGTEWAHRLVLDRRGLGLMGLVRLDRGLTDPHHQEVVVVPQAAVADVAVVVDEEAVRLQGTLVLLLAIPTTSVRLLVIQITSAHLVHGLMGRRLAVAVAAAVVAAVAGAMKAIEDFSAEATVVRDRSRRI